MPNCSVVGCGIKKKKNRPNISLHRLPKSNNKRKMWLDAVGIENLKTNVKSIFICSLHFEESCFNRTLDQTSLRDDAIPSRTLLPPAQSNSSNTLAEKDLNQTSSTAKCDASDDVKNVNSYIYQDPIPSVSNERISTLPVKNVSSYIYQDPIPSVSNERISTLPIPDATLETIKKLNLKCKMYKKKIKNLNEKVRRQKKKIVDFPNIIKDLKQSHMVKAENIVVLEECAGPKDFLKRQIAKSKGEPLEKKYSEELRKFAITLHFFSPKAYEFVRRQYNTCLPHQRTLTKWYENVDAEPGFCQEAFQALKTKVQTSNVPVVCSLIFDEMSIRKSLCWDPKKKTYCGRINIGTDSDSDTLEVASQCLVLLLTCVNGSWKLPVGYFFVVSLTGEQKANLMQMCVQKCEEVGAIVVSITCDGPATNFSMFSSLGCNLTTNQELTNFYCSESSCHAFIDPCHAMKLIRNAFGELQIFYDMYGREINFSYLERLLKLQETEGLHMATKLTKAHVMFAKQKMKVRLATQLLSNSVADALEYCENVLKLKDFEGCAGTINFIKLLNDVFDVLNSRSVRPPGWKKAICPQNIGLVEALFQGAIGYLRNLKLPSGQLVIESKRKTGFIGLIIDMNSALQLYRHLVENTKILKYLPLYKVSQDHLELFFSAIRARGGFNNNPNTVQFKAAFKRLLIRAEIRDGGMGNCIPLEQINILTCSSKLDPVTIINNLSDRSSFVEVPEDDSGLYEEFIDCLYNNNMTNYSKSIVTYIAGFLARKLSRTIRCETCVSLLFGDPNDFKSSLITLKSRGGLNYPSKDIENILTKTETLLKSVFLSKNRPELYYLYLFKFFMDYFADSQNLFNTGDSQHDSSHKYSLIKSIIQTYMDLRFKYFGKKSTEKITYRNYLNKIILFRNE